MYYVGLWYSFFKNGLAREMEYRWHFLAQFAMDIVWYSVQVLLFEVLFLYTPSIGGIGRNDMHLFLSSLFVIDALNMVLTSHNFFAFAELVRSGELDFYLLKPVSTVFLSSFRYPAIGAVFNLIVALGFMIVTMWNFPFAERWVGILCYPFFVVLGVATIVGFQLIFMGISIFTVGADGIQWIFYTIHNLGLRPDSIYEGLLRKLLLTIFPLSLIASIPARLLYANPDYLLIFSVAGAGLIFIAVAYRFFLYALTKYSGASA